MKTILTKALTIIHTALWLSACTGNSTENNRVAGQANTTFPYTLDEPSSRFSLPFEIEEVSGLSYIKDDVLATVQDEKGVVFIYDTKSKSVVEERQFAKTGDYEGIEVVGDTVYIVRSDGNLFKAPLTGEATEATSNFDTPLAHKNDVEGLAYDKANNRLLLACKGISGIGSDEPRSRAVYSFDLGTNTLTEEPAYLINIAEVKETANTKDNFRPSGLAVHPLSGQIYMVASVGKVLVVLNKNGSIESVQPLPPALFKQPEGICFAPNGDMLISNEGKGGRATILRFNYAQP